ncbi:MAG: CPBP family intramembrane metalloprotease [Verrucomicrobia bacterium]|nr:CPBP family intramembrane metalloprotease [Verrucomicrobiota bacterium]
MLSAKPWKSEAIVRLLLSVFICHFLGSVAMSVTRFPGAKHPVNPWAFGALVAGCVIFSGAALFSLRKPWDLDRFTRPFVAMLLCLYLGLTLGAFVQYYIGKPAGENPTLRTVVAALSSQGVALGFIWRFVREHRVGWRDAFGFTVNWKMALLLGAVVACIALPVGQVLQMFSAGIMSRLSVKPEMQPAIQALNNTVMWMDRVALGVVAIGLAPVAEEMLFRGILYPAVKQAGYPRAALWVTSLLFAAVHWNVVTFAPLLLLAIVLTLLYEKTNNLLAPIAAHSLFNALNFVMFFLVERKSG